MRFEVFHPGLLGRPDVIAVDMIHYPGLWGMCFSHHPPHNNHPRYAADTSTAGVLRFLADVRDGRTGLNLEMLANYIITTHHVDADALLPVWMLLHPDAALARREQLEEIARCGDFFIHLDDASAIVNFTIEELHRQLRGAGERGERLVNTALTEACFARLLPELEAMLNDPRAYAPLWEPGMQAMIADLHYLDRSGRVTEIWDRHTSLVETDHAPDVYALNTLCRNDLQLVWRTDVPERHIDVRPAIAWYELTSLPHRPRYAIDSLAARLNEAEKSTGHALVWQYRSGPVSLHAPCSQLSQETILETMQDWLDAEPPERVPAAYRADVREVFRYLDRHATFNSHVRFAGSRAVRFAPDACYGGLHCLEVRSAQQCLPPRATESGLLHIAAGKSPLPFAVSDDFYWNRAAPEPLMLSVTYVDNGPGAFWTEYDAWDTPSHPTPKVTLVGDGKLKTALFALDDARLGNSQEGGADLRLMRTPGTPLSIWNVELSKDYELAPRL